MTGKIKPQLRPPFRHSDEPSPEPQPSEQKSADWAKQTWREFDWKSAASLRAPERTGMKGQPDWDATEWDDPLNRVSQEARLVAEQIDSVAQKIRKGELTVSGQAPTPETAMAAALEALIRAK